MSVKVLIIVHAKNGENGVSMNSFIHEFSDTTEADEAVMSIESYNLMRDDYTRPCVTAIRL